MPPQLPCTAALHALPSAMIPTDNKWSLSEFHVFMAESFAQIPDAAFAPEVETLIRDLQARGPSPTVESPVLSPTVQLTLPARVQAAADKRTQTTPPPAPPERPPATASAPAEDAPCTAEPGTRHDPATADCHGTALVAESSGPDGTARVTYDPPPAQDAAGVPSLRDRSSSRPEPALASQPPPTEPRPGLMLLQEASAASPVALPTRPAARAPSPPAPGPAKPQVPGLPAAFWMAQELEGLFTTTPDLTIPEQERRRERAAAMFGALDVEEEGVLDLCELKRVLDSNEMLQVRVRAPQRARVEGRKHGTPPTSALGSARRSAHAASSNAQ